MDELHKLFIGMMAIIIVFTIMLGAAAEIQKHNKAYLDTLTVSQPSH